ncbi:MAG: Gfo/Idh/MocA family oxidoreductase [Verrucomicrobia bacterium]|nr:Gfo/Idh/MocA family oxidoreductase [Verrucomicrobiota bacterium]
MIETAMEPTKLGIIGCGAISGHHLELATKSPEVEVVAVADLIEERATKAAEKYDVGTHYLNDEDLLNDDRIEAVVLAMPVFDRTPVAYKALERGKHVLIEKPVAANVADVEKMMALRGDRVVLCGSCRMGFSGHAAAAMKCVQSGVLGKIRLVRTRAVHAAPSKPNDEPPLWRESMKLNGGGILVNWSCYEVDYMMHILGWELKPKTVLANWWPVADKMSAYAGPGSDADAHFAAFIQCEDDIAFLMERAEFSSATTDQAWEIIGTEGTLHVPMVPPDGKPNAVVLDTFVPGKGVVSETIWEEKDGGETDTDMDNFMRAIREGGKIATDLERSLVLQNITDAIYASATSGASVSIG